MTAQKRNNGAGFKLFKMKAAVTKQAKHAVFKNCLYLLADIRRKFFQNRFKAVKRTLSSYPFNVISCSTLSASKGTYENWFSWNLNFPATVICKPSCLLLCITHLYKRFNYKVLVVHSRNTAAESYNLRSTPYEPFISVFTDSDRNRKITYACFLNNFQNQLCYFICNIVSVFVCARKNNILIMLSVTAYGRISVNPLAPLYKKVCQYFTRFINRKCSAFLSRFKIITQGTSMRPMPGHTPVSRIKSKAKPNTLHCLIKNSVPV